MVGVFPFVCLFVCLSPPLHSNAQWGLLFYSIWKCIQISQQNNFLLVYPCARNRHFIGGKQSGMGTKIFMAKTPSQATRRPYWVRWSWVTAPHSSLVGKQRVPCHRETWLQRHSSRLVSLLGVCFSGRESLWCTCSGRDECPALSCPQLATDRSWNILPWPPAQFPKLFPSTRVSGRLCQSWP